MTAHSAHILRVKRESLCEKETPQIQRDSPDVKREMKDKCENDTRLETKDRTGRKLQATSTEATIMRHKRKEKAPRRMLRGCTMCVCLKN